MFEREAGLALEAVTKGGALLDESPVGAQVRTKESQRDIVSEYDLEVEKLAISVLSACPYPVLSEETNAGVKVEPGALFWAVDPIDGTVNFVNGLHYYGVSVGLCRQRAEGGPELLAGAVSMPKTKEHFFTFGSTGAFLNGARLSAFDVGLDSALVGASFSSGDPDSAEVQKAYLAFAWVNRASRGAVRLGSAAAQVCYVAAGRLQAAYGLGVHLWDVAGAAAIALQAGLTLRLEPVPDTTRVNFVVGAKRACEEIAARLRKEQLCRF